MHDHDVCDAKELISHADGDRVEVSGIGYWILDKYWILDTGRHLMLVIITRGYRSLALAHNGGDRGCQKCRWMDKLITANRTRFRPSPELSLKMVNVIVHCRSSAPPSNAQTSTSHTNLRQYWLVEVDILVAADPEVLQKSIQSANSVRIKCLMKQPGYDHVGIPQAIQPAFDTQRQG